MALDGDPLNAAVTDKVLQLEASAKPRDPDIAALVGELSIASREFRTWWSAPNPQTRTTGSNDSATRSPAI